MTTTEDRLARMAALLRAAINWNDDDGMDWYLREMILECLTEAGEAPSENWRDLPDPIWDEMHRRRRYHNDEMARIQP